MRVFIAVLVLIFSVQSYTKAEDIRDFQIDGMSVGDSLLDHFTLDEIEEALKLVTYYPKSKKMKVVPFEANNSDSYERYDFHIKDNDKDYIIYSAKGLIKISVDKCLNKKKSIISDIENILPNASKRNYINNYGNAYGKSEAHVNDFLMASGDIIRVWCQDWDHNNETVKSYKWWDGLAVNVSSKEQIDFVNKEAY